MRNSVDPDQTAPSGAVWSGSALFAYAILSDTKVHKILGHSPYQWNYDTVRQNFEVIYKWQSYHSIK